MEKKLIPTINSNPDADLSAVQIMYNQHILEINELKAKIADADAQIQVAEQQIAKEIAPLMSQVTEKKVAFVKWLDESYSKGYFEDYSYDERAKLRTIIKERCFELIYHYGVMNMRVIYQRQIDLDKKEEESSLTGMLGGFVSNIVEGFFEGLEGEEEEKKPQNEEEKARQRAEKRQQKEEIAKEQQQKKVKTKKETELGKLSRVLYTRLVHQLHPDKEKDPEVQLVKTEIMQGVTQAYQNDDIYELLKLQLEHIDKKGEGAADLAEEQVQVCNQMLEKQVIDLKNEFESLTQTGNKALIYRRFCGKTAKELNAAFDTEKYRLKAELTDLKQDLDVMLDKKKVRSYLLEKRNTSLF
jgi:hypothetical protein